MSFIRDEDEPHVAHAFSIAIVVIGTVVLVYLAFFN